MPLLKKNHWSEISVNSLQKFPVWTLKYSMLRVIIYIAKIYKSLWDIAGLISLVLPAVVAHLLQMSVRNALVR